MNTERNCQFCEHYKDGYCENLELKPCYPSKGCGDFSKRNELKKDTMEVLDEIRAEIEALPKTYPFINHIDTYVKEDDVKKIIDKYKAESEDMEFII